MGISEYNRENAKRIRARIEEYGVMQVAAECGVNWYYTSMTKKNPNYIPRNAKIATKMGYKVYRTSVPHGSSRGKIKRATIYPGTSVDKIKADLLDVTGTRWVPLVDEMEY